MKTLIQDIKINSVEEAEEILKAAGTEDLFEKAHTDGEMHPNGKWVWRSSANNGKGDWRVANEKKGKSGSTKENDEELISHETAKNLNFLLLKIGKEAKGFLYHTDGTAVSGESAKKRISESKVNSVSILDVLGTKWEDKIDRSAMKADKIANTYLIKYKENEGIYHLYKFKGENEEMKSGSDKKWSDFVSYSKRKKISDSLQKMSEDELKTYKEKLIKIRDRSTESSENRQSAKEKIWDIDTILSGYEKMREELKKK